jgi:glycosyltransferase involved in cell wall biosynthesis
MVVEIGFPRSAITTIRNGVELPRFAAADRRDGRRKLGLSDAEVVIGTVGRLVPVKDHATLLEAISRVIQAGLMCRAVIVGDGPLQADLEQRVSALGLKDRVILTGGRSDVPDMLAALDVFVLSSTSEGLSNVIQEAMTVGLPVVATRVGGAAELVTPEVTGLLVPPSNAAALADALLRLGADPALRDSFGRAGRARAEQEFTLAAMVRAYEDLYVTLASRTLRYEHNGRLSEA